MWFVFVAFLACSSQPPDSSEAPSLPVPSEPTVADPAPVVEELPSTLGTIEGEPILSRPSIIGGIANETVHSGIQSHMAAINACYESSRLENPELSGKVLVKFKIGIDGTVISPSTRSTSLRHEPTESCVNAEVAKVMFPPLEKGFVAVVHYPFVFPAPTTN